MTNVYSGFDTRIKKINRKRVRMVRGYKSVVSKDGLIVFKPNRRQASFPFRALAILAIGFFCFKGLIFAHAGAAVYQERLTQLENGTYVEQAGAFAMQADPVTQAIGAKLRPLLR